MPKKVCSSIFQKVSHLLKTSSVFIPKMRKPTLLISLKKSSKLKILKHYSNYGGYIQEYEFSPSNTPLIHQYHRKPLKNRDICSFFFLCSCFGAGGDGEDFDRNYPLEIKSLTAADVAIRELYESSDSSGGEEDSVDERAERFIERFYQEIKMQRKESVLYLT